MQIFELQRSTRLHPIIIFMFVKHECLKLGIVRIEFNLLLSKRVSSKLIEFAIIDIELIFLNLYLDSFDGLLRQTAQSVETHYLPI